MKFTDRQLLDMAVQCLKHARQSTAIRDCQCAACRGFMEQSEELLATIEQPTPETPAAPEKCKCNYPDAWHCARGEHMKACVCGCHAPKTGVTRPTEVQPSGSPAVEAVADEAAGRLLPCGCDRARTAKWVRRQCGCLPLEQDLRGDPTDI